MYKNWFIIAAFFIVIVFVYSVNQVLTPFLIAVFIAYLLNPVTDYLERKKMPRVLAVTLIFSLLSLLCIALLIFFIPLLLKQLGVFAQQLPEVIQWVYSTANATSIMYFDQQLPSIDTNPVKQLLIDNWKKAGSVATQFVGKVGASTIAIVSFVVNLLLIPVVAFYLLRDWWRLSSNAAMIVPIDYRNTVFTLLGQCDEALSAFIRGQLMVMLALGCIYSLGLSLIGLNLALLLGLLAGLASIVPYLGVAVGITSSVLAAYFQFYSFWPVVAVLGVFIVGQILESIVFTPIFVGDKIGLHPVVVIFAIMAGGELAGFTGVLISLPVSAVLVVLAKYLLEQYQTSSLFLSNSERENENTELHLNPSDDTQ